MRLLFFLVISLSSLGGKAQLYVGSNAYIYVKDQYVTVTSDVNLKDNSSFLYLRQDGQLLQKTTGFSSNSGNGNLSVYQEGTVNNYQYNYWCSPVGGFAPVAGYGTNGGFSIKQIGVPNVTNNPISFNLGTPISGHDGLSSFGSVGIADRWIYNYVSGNVYANWAYVGQGNTNPGLGFTMKGTSGTDAVVPYTGANANNTGSAQRYDFRGRPNDGTISNAVSSGNYTLIGNPYPSAIDIHSFLSDVGNVALLDGAVYYWEQVVKNTHLLAGYEGGYGVYTILGGYKRADIWTSKGDGTYDVDLDSDNDLDYSQDGLTIKKRFVPIGQGFMVKGIASGNVSMKNGFRVFLKESDVNMSPFAKMSVASDKGNDFFDPIPNVAGIDYTSQKRKSYAEQIRIKVLVNDNQGVIRTALGFADNLTDGPDYSADAKSDADDAIFSFYHILEGTQDEYCMSLTKFDENKGYPVGFRNKNSAKFKLKVNDLLYGFNPNQKIYMHDKLNDTYHDIKEGIFEIELPAGNVRDRFEITFKDAKLSKPEHDIATKLDVFADKGLKAIVVKNAESIDLSQCKIYDVSGKLMLDKKDLGNHSSFEFSTSQFSSGVYIVQVTAATGVEMVKKVIVE